MKRSEPNPIFEPNNRHGINEEIIMSDTLNTTAPTTTPTPQPADDKKVDTSCCTAPPGGDPGPGA
jgi:hypothetical protein